MRRLTEAIAALLLTGCAVEGESGRPMSPATDTAMARRADSAFQANEITPTEWAGLVGPWKSVMHGKRVFLNTDSIQRLGQDTFAILERIDIEDNSTRLGRDVIACDRTDKYFYRMVWVRRYSKGKKPSFEKLAGWYAEWDSVRSTPGLANDFMKARCAMARLYAK